MSADHVTKILMQLPRSSSITDALANALRDTSSVTTCAHDATATASSVQASHSSALNAHLADTCLAILALMSAQMSTMRTTSKENASRAVRHAKHALASLTSARVVTAGHLLSSCSKTSAMRHVHQTSLSSVRASAFIAPAIARRASTNSTRVRLAVTACTWTKTISLAWRLVLLEFQSHLLLYPAKT